jgi:RNA polymerase sigma factor (sigma-70 family)
LTPKSLIEPARHAGTALLRSQTDARLVDLTRDGNERAFEAIVQRYHRPLLRYCSRILSTGRAEDAVQQALLSAHRAIHAGDAELSLRPWLYRIVHNSALNMLRQNGFDHEEMSEEIDGVDTPPQIFERGERLRSVVAAVKDLPERQRDAIVLQAMEGRSYEEIAVELGVSDGAVRQLLNRARNTLREAAAAVTPTGLVTRIAAGGGDASVAERVAQAVSGAGGGALLVKAGATLVVAATVAGGAVTGALPLPGVHHGASNAAAEPPAGGGGNASGGAVRERVVIGPDGRPHVVRTTVRTVADRTGGGRGPARPGGRRGAQGGSVTAGPTDGGGTSGPSGGGGDRSGSGSSGSGGDVGGHSGSDGGGDHSGSGSSGLGGSGSSGSGDGGSGSSGSGTSGSGSSGSGTSGSGTSGSGSSGPGDGGTSGTSGSGDGGHSGSDGGSSSSGSSGSGGTPLSAPTTSGSDGSGSGGSTDGHSGPGSSGSH